MTKTTTETTMTETDMLFHVAARRIQGLTAKVNNWKQRANELEAALGSEKAARIEAEVTRDRALNAGAAMRDEMARFRTDLRTMSERSNGSEWEQKAVELEELRAELNLVKQERDCAKSEWDRAEGRCKTLGGEVAELFSDRQRLKAELAVIKDERNELRAKLEAIEAKIKASTCEPNTPTPRSHPVKAGEWVKRTRRGSG
jgi:chromosome segregation ATPase